MNKFTHKKWFCGIDISKDTIDVDLIEKEKLEVKRERQFANNLKAFDFPAKNLLQIKQLLTYRDQLVRIRTGLQNSIRRHKEYQKLSQLNFIPRDIQNQIDQYNRKIDKIEKQIKEIINSDQGLKKNYDFAVSVKGVGPIITTYMLVTTANFSSFENGRKYACYSGIAPFESSSGVSIKGKTKTSHLANKKLKTLLIAGANSAAKWDPEIRAYYQRKIKEGKAHQVVINAICCKLVNRIFAVVKRQSKYVSTYQQNFSQ